MRICIINSFYYPCIIGGAEISVQKLAEGLVLQGNEVHIICTGESEEAVINNVNVHRIKEKNVYQIIDVLSNKIEIKGIIKKMIYYRLEFYNIFNKSILFNTLKTINPDVVHVNNIYGISNVIWGVIEKLKIPYIFTARDYSLLCGIDNTEGNLKVKTKSEIVKKLTNNINIITAPSLCTLNIFKKFNYFKNSKFITVYNAIDFNITIIKEVLNKKKAELLKDKKKIKFVYLGRLESNKGIEILLNSFSEITNDNLELLIAGDGSLKNLVIEFQNKGKRIRYLGFLSESQVNNLLGNSDVLIIPSIWEEPFGRVVLDAYKNCMPVIGSDIGGIPEIVKNDFSGKLIEPGNKNNLIETINYFSKPENILKMIDNCVIQLNEFSIEKQIQRFLDIYKDIIKKHN